MWEDFQDFQCSTRMEMSGANLELLSPLSPPVAGCNLANNELTDKSKFLSDIG